MIDWRVSTEAALPDLDTWDGAAQTVSVVSDGHKLADRVIATVGDRVRLHRQSWHDGDGTLEPERIVEEIAAEGTTVVCIGHDVTLELAFAIASLTDRDHAEMSVLLVTAPSTDLWRDVLRSGIRDVVDPEAMQSELEPALLRALERSTRLRHQRTATIHELPRTGRVIVVLSPKGGSGKTMVASNLAVALAGMVEGSVAVVDLDVQFGDAASAFGLVPEHTIGQLAATPSIDSTALKVFLTPHTPSGAFVLCGAESPEEGDAVTDEHASQVVELLARDFAYVIVDTPAGVDERTLAVLEHATDVVLVSSMDVSSIRSLGKEIVALDRVGLLPAARSFVLNRADARVGIGIPDVESALGMSVDASVPSSRSVPLSMNQGRPIVLEEPASPVSRELARLARRLLDPTAAPEETRPRFLRRKRSP